MHQEPANNALDQHSLHHRTSWNNQDSLSLTPICLTVEVVSKISPRTLMDIMTLTKDGHFRVSNDNVEDVLLLAKRFRVTPLVQYCVHFLTRQLTAKNCISLIKFASHFHEGHELKTKGIQFLLQNFTQVFQESTEFTQLTNIELAEILWSDYLNVKQEEAVLEAIFHWVCFDLKSRKRFIPMLVSCLRVGLMVPEFLNDCLNSWLGSNNEHIPIFKRLAVLNVMAEVLSVQKQQMVTVNPVMFAPRIPRDILVVVGGSNFGFPLNIIEAFDCRTKQWLPMSPQNFAPRSYHGLVCLNEAIYIIGGFNGQSHLRSCCKFLPYLKSWEDVTPMISKRCYVGAVGFHGDIYAVGGYDGINRLNTAERFDVDKNEWTSISPMCHQRSDAGVAVVKDEIYVCGGFDGSECVRSVEVYAADSNTWRWAPSMLCRRGGLGVVVFKACLFAFGGFDGTDYSTRLSVLEYYNVDAKQWSVLSPMGSPRSNMAVAELEGILYTIGGYNGVKTMDVVECYDFDSDTWYFTTSLTHNRSALSGCVISGLSNASHILMRKL